MTKIYSGKYSGATGMASEEAGIGLSLGTQKAPVTLTGSAVAYGGSGYSYPSNSQGYAAGGEGGTGLAIITGTLTNDGRIYGGFGGNAISNGAGNGGKGGAAVRFVGHGILINHGLIDGGLGGFGGANVDAGAGGVGLAISGGLVFNDAIIYGGNGGGGGLPGGIEGNGGAGIVLHGKGIVVNSGTIAGGSGLVGGVGIIAGDGGIVINSGNIYGGTDSGTLGGAGVSLGMNGLLLNLGTIEGGSEYGTDTSGGVGAIIDGGAAPNINDGLIVGGSARPGTFGAAASGAAGVVMKNAGTLINNGTISGGAGAGKEGQYYAPAVVLDGGCTFINAGTILSGHLGASTEIALAFGNAGSSRLIMEPGSEIGGLIAAGGTSNVVELASGNFGLVSNFDFELASPYGDFQTLQLDSGSSGTISGLTTDYAFQPMVQLQYDSDWALSGSVVDLVNAGTANIESRTSLDIGSVDPSSSGIFVLTGNSSLEIGKLIGSRAQIHFIGSRNLLTIDTPSAFGLNLGGTNFAGPELEDFTKGDKIDLKGIGNTGLKTFYDSETGVLQIASSSGGEMASLQFATASLGAGSFHLASDGAGGSILKLG